MSRVYHFEVPFDTCQFTPFQLQPRTVCELGVGGWARWLKEYLVSFPRLIREHQVSVVVAGIKLTYLKPLTFFDADTLEIDFTVNTRLNGRFVIWEMDCQANDENVVQGRFTLVPVIIDDADSLSAAVGPLPSELLQRFTPDERIDEKPDRYVSHLAQQVETTGRFLAEGRHSFFLYRHVCEVADQWSYIELPAHVSASRERLALQTAAEVPEMRQGLSQPLHRFDAELRRPYYAFDEGIVETKAYCFEDRLTLVHRLLSDIGSTDPHAIAIEQF